MNSRRTNRAGFTLVETLVAGVLLALGASAITLAVRQDLHGLSDARDRQKAADLLDSALHRIDMFGPARLQQEGPSEGSFPEPYQRFAWAAQVELAAGETDLFEVAVTVSWDRGDGRRSQVVGHTLLYDPVGSRSQDLLWEDLQ